MPSTISYVFAHGRLSSVPARLPWMGAAKCYVTHSCAARPHAELGTDPMVSR